MYLALIWFLVGLFVGIDGAIVIWYLRSRKPSGMLLLDFYNDDADSVPISLELYIPIEELRKKKNVLFDVHESQ